MILKYFLYLDYFMCLPLFLKWQFLSKNNWNIFYRYSDNILELLSISSEEILSMFILFAFFFSLFAILGVNLWANSFDNRCRFTETP